MEIHIEDILIPDNRQRKEFDKDSILELAASIASKGLLHPVVVRNDVRTLVAGERRLRAIQYLHEQGTRFMCHGVLVDPCGVPITTIGELSPIEIEEAELEENIVRVDLTAQERIQARARLHEFRKRQNPAQTFKDTGEEISRTSPLREAQKVSQAVYLAPYLDDPDVAKAASESEIEKIVRKKLEREIRGALAETIAQSASPHKFHHADALEYVAGIPDNSFDVIVTDPPYGINADTFGDQGSILHEYSDDADYFVELEQTMAVELFRVTKPLAHLYWFCDISWWQALRNDFTVAGWNVWPVPLIWYKGNQGILPRPDFGPRRTYETILYAIKGNKPVTTVGQPDVISIPNITGAKLHAAEKPTALYKELLGRSALAGDSVFDPFCGSGPIFTAARELNLIATGIEINQDAAATAQLRCAGEI